MTLLQTVIDEAQGTVPATRLLKRMKVLGTRIGSEALLDWVHRELTGYPAHTPVPTYRGPIAIAPEGIYHGLTAAGLAQLGPLPLARTAFPEDMADTLFNWDLREPLATLEDAAREEQTSSSWPEELVRFYNGRVRQGKGGPGSDWACVSVGFRIPRWVYAGVVDQIRTTALDLALGLEQAAPLAGQPDAGDETRAAARDVVQHNHYYLFGQFDRSNLTIGASGTAHQQLSTDPHRQ
ncbi:hypothetical protein AB0C65_35735 [Nocardia sp. NPDC048505]|uniref:AbiTii domain-containing protein n=1 Tax=Nocardia sp. NPDC048505 TaxID=3155756 RepID=UPI0033F8ED38